MVAEWKVDNPVITCDKDDVRVLVRVLVRVHESGQSCNDVRQG